MEVDPKQVLGAFGVHEGLTHRIHPWSPVYRVGPSGSWVLKKTAKRVDAARALAAWTRAMAAAGIRTVAPVSELATNPLRQDDVCWVIYPFISGEPYRAHPSQVAAAGALLGRIHSFWATKNTLSRDDQIVITSAFNLNAEIPDPIAPNELAADLITFEETFGRYAPDLLPLVDDLLKPAFDHYTERTLPALRGVSFPTVLGSWDFKASNLVYEQGDQPVLIDPDNAGLLPRIFDLAIAVVLFHNFDAPAAPRRLFDAMEWRSFRDAYLGHVALTSAERAHWRTVLSAAWIDEGFYALVSAKEEWGDSDIRPWLESVMRFEPERFALD